jgi:DNA-nicking Smr family endonuclease
MIRRGRSLSREEARLWAAVADTVKPISGKAAPPPEEAAGRSPDGAGKPRPINAARLAAMPVPPKKSRHRPAAPRPFDAHGLDAGWERKLAKALLHPDFTLDLHGHTVAAAHARLDSGLGQAAAMGARLVLVITGRPRPVEAADRGTARGAIRAKVLDWLALGPHASRIAAVRPAQRRHGGAGALYVVLRRPK